MSDEIVLSIVIPAYKESDNLKMLLPQLQVVLDSLQVKSEILVIDTQAAMDSSSEISKNNGAKYFNREQSNCYGDAIRTGIKYITGRFTVFMDADGSHDPNFIKNLYEYRNDFDVVVASRYVDGGNTANSRVSIIMSLILNKVFAVVLGIKCKDVSNSFKLYHSSDLKKLVLKCDNFDIIEEILYRIKENKNELKIKEIPFLFKKRMFGVTKRSLIVFIFSYIKTIIRLRLM